MPITPTSATVAIRTLFDSTSRTRLPRARDSDAASLANALPLVVVLSVKHLPYFPRVRDGLTNRARLFGPARTAARATSARFLKLDRRKCAVVV